ncbi:MAG: ribosome-binding factor A [Actinomycetota bacterium]|jgi:ribosome-binding factor A
MSQAAKPPRLDRKGSAGNTMGRPQGRSRGRSSNSRKHSYPREARISETVREVVAEELLRIDDDRLAFVSITAIDVDAEMNRGIVYFDSLQGPEGDAGILAAFSHYRKQLQSAIATQVHARRTPILEFRPDDAIRAAARIDEVLRNDPMHTRNLSDDTE